MSYALTWENVEKVFTDCLYRDADIASGVKPLSVEGLRYNFGFHPGRVVANIRLIEALLDQLDDNFRADKGGGWSFLNICSTKDGRQWGDHPNGEQLVAVAIAAGKMKYLLPRPAWEALPGGVPYLVIPAAEQAG